MVPRLVEHTAPPPVNRGTPPPGGARHRPQLVARWARTDQGYLIPAGYGVVGAAEAATAWHAWHHAACRPNCVASCDIRQPVKSIHGQPRTLPRSPANLGRLHLVDEGAEGGVAARGLVPAGGGPGRRGDAAGPVAGRWRRRKA